MQPPRSRSSPLPLHWGLESLAEESDYLSETESSPTRSTHLESLAEESDYLSDAESSPTRSTHLESLAEESDYLSDAESSPTRSTQHGLEPLADESDHLSEVESSRAPAASPFHVIPGSWIDELDIDDTYTLLSDTEERETTESELELEEGDHDHDHDHDDRGEICQIKVETMPLEMIDEEIDGEEEDGAEEEGAIRQVTRRSMIVSTQTGNTDTPHSTGTPIGGDGGYSNSQSTLATPMKSKSTNAQIQIPSILAPTEETMVDPLEISIDSLDCSSSPSSSSASSPTGTQSPKSTPGSRRGRAPHVELPDELDSEQIPGVHHWEESAVSCVEKSLSPSPSITISSAGCSSGSSSSSISTTSDIHDALEPATSVQPKTWREHNDLGQDKNMGHPRTRANSLDAGLTAHVAVRMEEERQDPQVATKAPVAPRLKARPATSSSTARPPFHSLGLTPQRQVEPVTWQSFFLPSPLPSAPLGMVHRPVPPESVVVRVWAVGLDGVDGLLAAGVTEGDDGDRKSGGTRRREKESVGNWSSESWPDSTSQTSQGRKTRNPFMKLSQTLSAHLGKQKKKGLEENSMSPSTSTLSLNLSAKGKMKLEPRAPTTRSAPAPHIPGRSFVGRLTEIGENVGGEIMTWSWGDHRLRKGDWVVGLVDVKKGGALAEFITVDWQCVHQVPEEWITIPSGSDDHTSSSNVDLPHEGNEDDHRQNKLTLEELALLPLCGIPAYRAVSTILEAFADDHHHAKEFYDSTTTTTADETDSSASQDDIFPPGLPRPTRYRRQRARPRRTRRALILRGTDGAGALATQMLVRLGWRVSIHAPFSRVPESATQELAEAYMCSVEGLARSWGADEVIFDDAEAEREGEEEDDSGRHWRTREAVVRVMEMARMEGDVFDAVLDTVGGTEIREAGQRLLRATDMGHFTTLVGDEPELAIPTMRHSGHAGYSCVNVAHDDEHVVSEVLGTILKLAIKAGVRPVVEEASGDTFGRETRVIEFDRALDVFMDGKNHPSAWWLTNGGTLVVTKLV